MASKNSKDYYKDARIKFKFSMPFDTGVAEFSTKEMLWMDTAAGYGYKVGYEDVKGAKYQTLTCWRHVNGTKDNPSVNPSRFRSSYASISSAHSSMQTMLCLVTP